MKKEKNGLTIRQIAEEIQRSKSAVGRFLKGEENPRIPKKRGIKSIISDRVKRGNFKCYKEPNALTFNCVTEPTSYC